jgi:hypothetical protein
MKYNLYLWRNLRKTVLGFGVGHMIVAKAFQNTGSSKNKKFQDTEV